MPLPHPPRILLLIPHLGGGGAERVIETLARSLNPAKYEVHLALVTGFKSEAESLPSSTTIHELRTTRVRRAVFKLLRLVWRLRPSLILSGISHLNLLVLALRPLLPASARILVRQNGELGAALAPHPRIFSRRAHSLTYRRADRIVCQTRAMAHEIERGLRVHPSKLTVLPNPTDLARLRSTALPHPKPATTAPTLLAVGRLAPEKGFDILLDAFASLSARFQSAELIIAGTGAERRALEQQSQGLGISNRVRFTGHLPDPLIQCRQASLFVLSSRTEGLPNALLEAAAAGFPIVATPASPGVVELLQGREGVWLATETSSSALRAALESALDSIQTRPRYPHPWIEEYDHSRAIPAYEALIDQLTAGAAQ